jgi:hypothetical protein
MVRDAEKTRRWSASNIAGLSLQQVLSWPRDGIKHHEQKNFYPIGYALPFRLFAH